MNKYEVTSTHKYQDEVGHKRLLIHVKNKSTKETFEIMVNESTGLTYIIEDKKKGTK